jgi:hypothetical protein
MKNDEKCGLKESIQIIYAFCISLPISATPTWNSHEDSIHSSSG